MSETGFPLSWKMMETMENEKIESRPGKVMEKNKLAKSHGKVMDFFYFSQISVTFVDYVHF